ncbi:MAG: hypothetical protein K8T26_15705 [Lentisphaerae bacterium]|nr:hypothetical protein [Lentisphaerota bacterium]
MMLGNQQPRSSTAPWRRTALGLLAALLASGCSGHWMPSERAIYAKACAAIQALPDLPAGSQPMTLDDCRFFVGKSAGRIDVPVSLNGATTSYTVWFKRVARTWEPSGRAYLTTNPPPGAGSMSPDL